MSKRPSAVCAGCVAYLVIRNLQGPDMHGIHFDLLHVDASDLEVDPQHSPFVLHERRLLNGSQGATEKQFRRVTGCLQLHQRLLSSYLRSIPARDVGVEGPSVHQELVVVCGEVEDQSVWHPSYPGVTSILAVLGEITAGTVELDDTVAWRDDVGV